jgi:hypothetical protein
MGISQYRGMSLNFRLIGFVGSYKKLLVLGKLVYVYLCLIDQK